MIFDEAHQLPETARLFFGETRVDRAADRAGARRAHGAARRRRRVARARRARGAAGEGGARPAPGAGRGRARASRWRRRSRCPALPTRSKDCREALRRCAGAARSAGRALRGARRAARGARRRAHRALLRRLREDATPDEVRWVEVFGQAAQLHITPLSLGGAVPQADGRPSARVDLHLGDARRGRATSAISRASWARPKRRRARWASPFDFGRAGAALPAARPAGDPNDAGFTEAVVDAALPVLASERRPRIPALHHAARAAHSAHELLRGAASTFPLLVQGTGSRSELLERFRAPRQRGAARQPVVLGGRRRARRGAVAGGDRQAAVRAARRSGARGAHRGACKRARRQSVHRAPAAAGGAAAQAGRRPADPRRDRPRRADAVRPAPGVEALRSAHPAAACRR